MKGIYTGRGSRFRFWALILVVATVLLVGLIILTGCEAQRGSNPDSPLYVQCVESP
jgi:hypothetical protein